MQETTTIRNTGTVNVRTPVRIFVLHRGINYKLAAYLSNLPLTCHVSQFTASLSAYLCFCELIS